MRRGSLLRPFIVGARTLLAAQLVLSILAVALAGWTLSVTGELLRERNRLQERVIQLEETMAARGQIPPAPAAVVERAPPARDAYVYPASIANAAEVAAAPSGAPPAHSSGGQRSIAAILDDIFGPAEALQTVVLHVRAAGDAAPARAIAQALNGNGTLRILISVMPPDDTRQSGYVYFDGRQSRAAAEIVARFHDAARLYEIAPWSAQLRGAALPSQGEYSADRLDIVLPSLPPPPAANLAAPQPAAPPE